MRLVTAKKLVLVVAVAALAACAGQGANGESAVTEEEREAPAKLVVGFLPLENPETLAPEADAFADYLSQELGMPVEAFVPTEYAPLVEALRADRAHVAFMGSLATVMAHELAGAQPILGEIQRGEAFYRSQYYVRNDSDIESLDQLEGRSVAFTSPTGGSGFVFPVNLLVEEGLLASGADPKGFFSDVVFAGGDEQVLKAVLRGDVDAGATSDYAPNLFLDKDEIKELKVISSIVVPPHSVVVSDSLPEDLIEEIQLVLLEMAKPDNIETLRAIYGADGFVPVTLEDYESVVEAARAAGFDFETLIGS